MTKQINELNITINKAVIEKVTLELKKEGLRVEVQGGLYTTQNKRLSSFDFDTNGWSKESTIEVPAYINAPVKEIFEQLTPIIYEKFNGLCPSLKSGLKK